MNTMKNVKQMVCATFIFLFSFSATGLYAQTYSPPVSIIFQADNSGSAEGSLGGTRNSGNFWEYIQCRVSRDENIVQGSLQQNVAVVCLARDANLRSAACTSNSDAIARGLAGMSTDAIIGFSFDAAGNCTSTLVYKSSSLAPKN